MAYQYRGTKHDLTVPAQPIPTTLPKVRGPKPKPFLPGMCGTSAGYKQHKRRDVPVCEPCQAAYNAYMASYMVGYKARQPKPEPKPRQLAPCGTFAGARRHERDQEPLCDDCTTARREYAAEYARNYRARKAAA